MKAQSTKNPFKDNVTKELEKQVALEFANFIEQNNDLSFDDLVANFYSNVIENYNNNNEKLVGFSINKITDYVYDIDVWYW